MPGDRRSAALERLAELIRSNEQMLLSRNNKDLTAQKSKLSAPLYGRLSLTSEKLRTVAAGIDELVHLEDPIGVVERKTELDEAYFGGNRGRAAAGKNVVFWLLEREHRVYTKVVESVSAEELIRHIQAKTRKGSVFFPEMFRGYQSLKRYGKHHTINYSKAFVSPRQPRNHINGN